MANVVIVSKHLFYNNSGIDTSMVLSSSDIIPFSNMQKAIEFVEEQIKYVYATEEKFERYEYTKEECKYNDAIEIITYSQQTYNKRNIRHSYRIMKKKIE